MMNYRQITAAALYILLMLLHAPSFASTKITVNGMVCSFCAQGIEKNFLKMDATKDVFVDLKNKVVILEFKDGKSISEKSIVQEINDSGYDVVKIEAIPQSVSEFKTKKK